MPASLKYYKVDYVPISDRMYYEYADELLRHIRELVELENGINFTGNAEIAIVLTDEELEIFWMMKVSVRDAESSIWGTMYCWMLSKRKCCRNITLQ